MLCNITLCYDIMPRTDVLSTATVSLPKAIEMADVNNNKTNKKNLTVQYHYISGHIWH